MGMAAGLTGDVISFFAAPQTGPFFPGFTISYTLLGFLFGLILYRSKMTPLRALAAGLAELSSPAPSIPCGSTSCTAWNGEYLFTIRLIKNTVSLGVNTVMIFIFMKAFSRILLSMPASLKASRHRAESM